MTCGSPRSGIASSFAWRIDQTAPAVAIATPSSAASRLRAHSSMMRATMRGSSAGLGGGSEALDGGAQAALRVDEEVGRRHDPLALGEALEDLHAIVGLHADPHRARLEPAAV